MKIKDLQAMVDRLVAAGHGDEKFAIFSNDEACFVENAAIIVDDDNEAHTTSVLNVVFSSETK